MFCPDFLRIGFEPDQSYTENSVAAQAFLTLIRAHALFIAAEQGRYRRRL
jgi:hypothetical protein